MTSLPATATFKLAPGPTIGISTRASALSTRSSGDPPALVTQEHDGSVVGRLEQREWKGTFD